MAMRWLVMIAEGALIALALLLAGMLLLAGGLIGMEQTYNQGGHYNEDYSDSYPRPGDGLPDGGLHEFPRGHEEWDSDDAGRGAGGAER